MCEFTAELLRKEISKGRNIVFSYPAGSGKTTAIKEYIVNQIKNNDIDRKIIYVAPTKSLLDDMYTALVNAGLSKNVIFNYHSSSPDYLECKKHGQNVNDKIRQRVKYSVVILITHERMKFDIVQKFLGQIDFTTRSKPLVLLDESIEDCNIATMSSYTLDTILQLSGLIELNETHHDYLNKPHNAYLNGQQLCDYLTTPREYNADGNKNTLAHLEIYNIQLLNNMGFGRNANMLDPYISGRFETLYSAMALTIAQGRWIDNKDRIYINVPIAIHESWKHYAQIVVMDATAFIDNSIYQDFEMRLFTGWNSNLLTNFTDVSKKNSRNKLMESPERILEFLDKINLRNYEKLYIVTFKETKIQKQVIKYLSEKYPEYKVICDEKSSQITEDFLETDIDATTDEFYAAPVSNSKIVYLTNFGKTRGSNVFKECDCVIQIGNYRVNPEFLNQLNMIYPGISSNQLSLANFIQELYRGRIRCNQKMDSYALIEDDFYEFMKKELDNLGFTFKRFDDVFEKDPYAKYGMNKHLVEYMSDCKLKGKAMDRCDLLKESNNRQWVNVKKRLLNLYKKYPELRENLFNRFETIEEFREFLTLSKSTERQFSLKL